MSFETLTIERTEALVKRSAPIAPYTTFGIGGPADVLVEVYTEQALQKVVAEAMAGGMRWLLIGGGSNLLVGDTGFRGVVIVNKIDHLRVDGNRITAGAGADLGEVVEAARQRSLSGLEFAIDIPGTVGGAIRGNAGAFGRSVADVATRIRLLEGTTLVDRKPSELGFAYRHSILKTNTNIVVETEFTLQPGDRAEMDRIMGQHAAQRARRHEKGLHTAGCFFKNPVLPDGSKIAAGQLLEAAGAKEIRDGGAGVHAFHANYIVNKDHATAHEVLRVAREMKRRVEEANGITLEEEVMIVMEPPAAGAV
ncbi:MAG TPA: UDP-N-acetylmuramate dehydrogenase [Candidatus Eisenbacteria bacterium]|nr:UDP-N-acetylmuramate dehydrogenase [Candidatus Eisenbacteria bacterium]